MGGATNPPFFTTHARMHTHRKPATKGVAAAHAVLCCPCCAALCCAACKQAVLEKEADLKAEEADDFCAATPVTRLVLVVHGIGQQLSAANIAQARTRAGCQVGGAAVVGVERDC